METLLLQRQARQPPHDHSSKGIVEFVKSIFGYVLSYRDMGGHNAGDAIDQSNNLQQVMVQPWPHEAQPNGGPTGMTTSRFVKQVSNHHRSGRKVAGWRQRS